jgi:hypothetical protein
MPLHRKFGGIGTCVNDYKTRSDPRATIRHWRTVNNDMHNANPRIAGSTAHYNAANDFIKSNRRLHCLIE